MVTTTQIRRYAWVVELLQRRRHLTLGQIKNEWVRSALAEYADEKLDRKTWYKCFDDISMIYGIIIEVDKSFPGFYYHIVNPEALRGKDVQQWMLGCVAHRNLMEEFLGMNNRIDIEGFPSENGMLEPIAQAMKDNRKMEVTYQRYGMAPKPFIIEPYFIKTYQHRFYVLCKIATGLFYTLSFDRIKQVNMLRDKFNFPNDLFAQDFFVDSFGVMVPNGKEDMVALDIVVRAKYDACDYLLDVPMHHSQHIIYEGSEYVDFMVHIFPTNDFIGYIMHQGDRLEILSPDSVRLKIKAQLGKALALYS